ncbi:MAG: EamA family transporter [Candidatus Gracilibacteria bacterium]
MSWIFLSILAAAIFAGVCISDKFVLANFKCKPVLMLLVSAMVGLVFGLGAFAWNGFVLITGGQLLLAFISSLSFVGMLYFYFKAMELEDVSKVVPLFYINPLFILLLAGIFLNESLTIQNYLGVFLLVIGAIFLSFKKSLAFKSRLGFLFTILSALCIAINQVILKYLLNFLDYWTVFAYIRISSFVIIIPILIYNFADLKRLFLQKLPAAGLVVLNESFSFLAYLILTFASGFGAISLINALMATQPFFVLLFTLFLSLIYPRVIDEKIKASTFALKFAGVMVMLAGVSLIGSHF